MCYRQGGSCWAAPAVVVSLPNPAGLGCGSLANKSESEWTPASIIDWRGLRRLPRGIPGRFPSNLCNTADRRDGGSQGDRRGIRCYTPREPGASTPTVHLHRGRRERRVRGWRPVVMGEPREPPSSAHQLLRARPPWSAPTPRRISVSLRHRSRSSTHRAAARWCRGAAPAKASAKVRRRRRLRRHVVHRCTAGRVAGAAPSFDASAAGGVVVGRSTGLGVSVAVTGSFGGAAINIL